MNATTRRCEGHQGLERAAGRDALRVPEVEDREQRQQEQHLHPQALGRVPEIHPAQLVPQGGALGIGYVRRQGKQRIKRIGA
ncbi:MAG: hypothetical protein R6W97_02380 [Thiobacillus sp.]